MSYRIVFIENESRLSLKLNNLVINKGEGDIWIPLSDISMVVIDNLNITITARMMSVFAENNIGLIFTDAAHMPIGYFGAYDNHSRASKIIGFQIEKEQCFYDELWSKLVKEKIYNQSSCLEKIKGDNIVAERMREYAADIKNGDVTNREAHAAKIYFNELMGETFSRGNDDILLNSGLDYGYSIIRAFIARVCAGYGLNTQLGIHHRNEYNRFNLVDDLIEPIRPFVDGYAYKILNGEEYFKSEHRHKLVNILNHKVSYNGKNMYICNMIEEYVEEYAAYVSGRRNCINFPKFDDYQGSEDEI